jgi:hypothetical protein
MSKPKTCIRVTGTRSGKLRARVTIAGKFGPDTSLGYLGAQCFNVTIGGQKWYSLGLQLRLSILCRARDYVNSLDKEAVAAIEEFEAFEQSEGIHTDLDCETLGLPAICGD